MLAAQEVFAASHWFEMVWIYARTDPAKMIEFKPNWNQTTEGLEGKSVRHDVAFAISTATHNTVSVSVYRASP